MFERDKILHFIGGFIIAFVVGLYEPFIGVGVALLAGLFKEYIKDAGLLSDWFPSAPQWLISYGVVDWRDLAYTILGGYIGALIALVVM